MGSRIIYILFFVFLYFIGYENVHGKITHHSYSNSNVLIKSDTQSLLNLMQEALLRDDKEEDDEPAPSRKKMPYHLTGLPVKPGSLKDFRVNSPVQAAVFNTATLSFSANKYIFQRNFRI